MGRFFKTDQSKISILFIIKKASLDPLKEKFETRIAAYDYTLEKLGKRIFALEDNLETALHKILEQQSTIKKLSYAQVFYLKMHALLAEFARHGRYRTVLSTVRRTLNKVFSLCVDVKMMKPSERQTDSQIPLVPIFYSKYFSESVFQIRFTRLILPIHQTIRDLWTVTQNHFRLNDRRGLQHVHLLVRRQQRGERQLLLDGPLQQLTGHQIPKISHKISEVLLA